MNPEEYRIYRVEGHEPKNLLAAEESAMRDRFTKQKAFAQRIGADTVFGVGHQVDGVIACGVWKRDGWNRYRGDLGGSMESDQAAFIPDKRTREGKEALRELVSLSGPRRPNVHLASVVGFDAQGVLGNRWLMSVAWMVGEAWVVAEPAIVEARDRPGFTLLKTSEFYALKESTKEATDGQRSP